MGVTSAALTTPADRADPTESPETGRAGWLGEGSNALFAVLHSPTSTSHRTGVLIVPPFGWQELISYRARRHWATRLARAGFPTLRYDLPGAGDSYGSPSDSGLFDAWVQSVGRCAEFLRSDPAISRVAVFGIGLGALIAAVALERGAPIDDLLLWGAQRRGRGTLREMAGYAAIVTSDYAQEADTDLEGALALAGFYMSPETVSIVNEIDLEKLALPARPGGRALLLSRDSLRSDASLERVFTGAGMVVETARGNDFGDLMTPPQDPLLRRPEATINRSIAWLEKSEAGARHDAELRGDGPRQPAAPAFSALALRAKLVTERGDVTETILPLTIGTLRTNAILAEPVSGDISPVTAVLFNPGALRKVGLHRMSVEIARRWASQGVRTVRFDSTAIGDASGPEDDGGDERPGLTSAALMSPASTQAVAEVIGHLREHGLAEQFLSVGHCSGAYLAFQAALGIDGAVGAITINQPAISHNNDLYQAQMFQNLQQALRGGFIRRWRQNRLTLRELKWARDAIVHRLRVRGQETPERRHRDDAIVMLDTLALREVPVTMLVTRGIGALQVLSDPEFPDLSRWTNLRVTPIPSDDGTYHALHLQRLIHAQADDAMMRILADAAAG